MNMNAMVLMYKYLARGDFLGEDVLELHWMLRMARGAWGAFWGGADSHCFPFSSSPHSPSPTMCWSGIQGADMNTG